MMGRTSTTNGSPVWFVMGRGKVLSKFFTRWASMLLLSDSFAAQPNHLSFDLPESSFRPQVLGLDLMKSA